MEVFEEISGFSLSYFSVKDLCGFLHMGRCWPNWTSLWPDQIWGFSCLGGGGGRDLDSLFWNRCWDQIAAILYWVLRYVVHGGLWIQDEVLKPTLDTRTDSYQSC